MLQCAAVMQEQVVGGLVSYIMDLVLLRKKSIIYKYVLLVAGCSVILAPTVTGFENKIKQQQNFNEGEEKSKICCHVHHGWFLLVDLWM